jgi:hypothetical protein
MSLAKRATAPVFGEDPCCHTLFQGPGIQPRLRIGPSAYDIDSFDKQLANEGSYDTEGGASIRQRRLLLAAFRYTSDRMTRHE